jgi:uncharacterized protein YoxC
MTEPYRYKPQYDQVKFLSKQPSSFINRKYDDEIYSPTVDNSVLGKKRGDTKSSSLLSLMDDGADGDDAKDKIGNSIQNFVTQPRNLIILAALILLLLLLWFLAHQKSVNTKHKLLASSVENISKCLKTLDGQQQRLLSAQQNQLELIQTSSMRNDELFQSLGKDLRQTLSMLMLTTNNHQPAQIIVPQQQPPVVPQLSSLPQQQLPNVVNFNSFNVPRRHGNDDDDENDENNLLLQSQGQGQLCQEDGTGICSEFKRRQSSTTAADSGVNVNNSATNKHPASLQNGLILPKLISAMPGTSSGPRSRSLT